MIHEPVKHCARYNVLMHRFLLHNDEVLDAGEKIVSPGQVGLLSGWGVFTTIRVYDGVLFAWERHWERMKRDAALLRVPFPADPDWLENNLLKLVEANQAQNATLRVVVARNRGGMWEGPDIDRDFDVVAFTHDLKDWGSSVRLGVAPNARHAASRFAGTKILSWAQNLAWNEEAASRGLDEVVLLNERGEVAELTSANIFAVFGRDAATPPLSAGCLPGITRQLLVEEVRVPGIQVSEKTLFLKDLAQADEVFVTSSTRELLPVASIEGIDVRQGHAVCDQLGAALATYMKEYAVLHRRPAGARSRC